MERAQSVKSEMQAAIDAAYAAGRACAAQVEDLRREMEEAKRAAEAFSNHCQSLSPYRLSLACSSLAPVLPPSGRLPPVSSLSYPSTRPSWPGALRRCDTPAPRWGCPAKASPIRACGLRRSTTPPSVAELARAADAGDGLSRVVKTVLLVAQEVAATRPSPAGPGLKSPPRGVQDRQAVLQANFEAMLEAFLASADQAAHTHITSFSACSLFL